MSNLTDYNRMAIIINPAAGKPFPILHAINAAFTDARFMWQVYITKKASDVTKQTHQLVKQLTPDAIAVYGGGDTVHQVAEAVIDQDILLLIIPGGTANSLATELNIPTRPEFILQAAADQKLQQKAIDTGTAYWIRVTPIYPAGINPGTVVLLE